MPALWRLAGACLAVGLVLRVLALGTAWEDAASYTLVGLGAAAASVALWRGGWRPVADAVRSHRVVVAAVGVFALLTLVAALTG